MKHYITSTKYSFTKVAKAAAFGVSGLAALALSASPALTGLASASDCVQNAPVVVATPASQTGDAGTALNYTVNVTNADTATCAVSSVSVQNNSAPTGWTVTSDSAVDLLPGQSHDFNVAVTSTTSSLDGDYSVPMTALKVYSVMNPEEPFATIADFSLGYTVTNGGAVDTEAPVVAVTSPANGSQVLAGSTTYIVASATDNVAVTNLEFYVNGQLLCSGTSTSCAWAVPENKNRRNTKTYNLEVRAYDAAGNTSSAFSTVEAV